MKLSEMREKTVEELKENIKASAGRNVKARLVLEKLIKDEKFSLYRKLLTIYQEEIEDEFNEKELDMNDLLTPFEYLLNSCLTILSSREWKLITQILPPLEVISISCVKVSSIIFNSQFVSILVL